MPGAQPCPRQPRACGHPEPSGRARSHRPAGHTCPGSPSATAVAAAGSPGGDTAAGAALAAAFPGEQLLLESPTRAQPPPRFVTVRPRQPEKNSLSSCSQAFKVWDFKCLRELRYPCKKTGWGQVISRNKRNRESSIPSVCGGICSPPSSHCGPQPRGAAGGRTQSQQPGTPPAPVPLTTHPTLWSQYPSRACVQRAQPTNPTGLSITNAISPPFGATSHSKRQNKSSKSLSRGLPSPPLDPPWKVLVTELKWVNKLELENRCFLHRQERLVLTQS